MAAPGQQMDQNAVKQQVRLTFFVSVHCRFVCVNLVYLGESVVHFIFIFRVFRVFRLSSKAIRVSPRNSVHLVR